MSDAIQAKTTNRIQVTFGVDLPVQEIEFLRNLLKSQQPGSAEHSKTWGKLKAHHAHFVGRLDGECAAYMNIAKEQAKQIFGT